MIVEANDTWSKKHLRDMIYGDMEKGWLIKGEVAFPPKELCVDWTDVEDMATWRWLVEKRHRMTKDCMALNNIVKMTSAGKSIEPLMRSGDTFEVRPMGGGYTVKAGDIVFCQVQPGNRHFIHLVCSVEEEMDKEYEVVRKVYYIGNNKKGNAQRYNGWCHAEHIYGDVPRNCVRKAA